MHSALGPEPRLRRMGPVADGQADDLLPAGDAASPREAPGLTDHAASRGRARVLRLERADLVPHLRTQVPHGQVTVRPIEQRGPVRLAGGVGLAPVHVNRLARHALDARDPDPDAGAALVDVPLFDLMSQGRTRARAEAQVLALVLGLPEVEPLPIEAKQEREASGRIVAA